VALAHNPNTPAFQASLAYIVRLCFKKPRKKEKKRERKRKGGKGRRGESGEGERRGREIKEKEEKGKEPHHSSPFGFSCFLDRVSQLCQGLT
jgi:hypothetical protein